MKGTLLKQLEKILRVLARKMIKRHEPWIVGITGSVGKTSTKKAVYEILSTGASVRMAGGNLNNELGLPLAILGDHTKTGGLIFWVKVVLVSLWRVFFQKEYPDVLVLEYAADKPGDIAYLLTIARPNVSVVTAVGKVPVHVEFYESPEAVAREKGRIVHGLRVSDLAVLNADDPFVSDMANRTRGRVMRFGFDEHADVKIVSFENRSENGVPKGISFKLETNGAFVPVKIDGVFGKAHAYAAAAAACVGLMKGINLVKISEALASYRGEPGRMQLVPGTNGTFILDDTYNAAPLSVSSALEVLGGLEVSGRKIAVLGEMAELGKFTTFAHEDIGKRAGAVADLFVAVGPHAGIFAEGARKAGLAEEKMRHCKSSKEAAELLKTLVRPGDVILVKGSQRARMERTVYELMEDKGAAKDLLVRQYGKWIS